jgi:hypothetical protein
MNKLQTVFFVSLLFLCGALISCQSSKTPLQVSEHFWMGMQAKNVALVKKYSLFDSIDESEDLTEFEEITTTTFGRIIIDNNVAEVETTVTTFLNEEKVDIKLNTYLENNNEVWKVDYRKTVLQLAVNQNMAEVFDDIEEITEEITEQIEESVEEIKEKVVPEIKSELEQVEKEILKKIPELKSVFEEFLQQLEKSLEELIPDEVEDEEVKTQET